MRSLDGEQVAVSIDIGGRRDGELSMLEHVSGVSGGEVACLGTEVQEDGVRLPVAQSTDGCLVNARDEERCGSTGSQAVGFDAIGRDVCDVFNISGGCSEFGRW